MSKRPSFQFYPADWRNEPSLRLCSTGARGLWIEMMCLMHEGEPYGHLTMLGMPLSPEQLARLCGEAPASIIEWLEELRQVGVYSVSEAGAIFSRRMVRDEMVREKRAACGPAGADHGSKGGRPKKPKPLPDNRRGSEKTPSVKKPKPLVSDEWGSRNNPPSSSSSSPSPSSSPSEGRDSLPGATSIDVGNARESFAS